MTSSLRGNWFLARSANARAASGLLRLILQLLILACCHYPCSSQTSAKAASPLPQLAERFEVSATQSRQYDTFGWSVAVDGNYAVVGMPYTGSGPGPSRAAFVYRLDTGQLVRT